MTEPPQYQSATVGLTVAGRYELVRLLGEGGMGQVFEAEHLALGRRFALKVLRLERWSDELVQRFQREARALARISSPRVAQVTDFGVEERLGPFYVMELVEGETLERRIGREGRLGLDEALHVAAETAEALAEVHQTGIVHRDVKPSNIGLPPAGPVAVKLLDFGLAASVDDSFMQRITRSQQVLGSLPYMAPEQFHGARPAPTMDVYAVGVVLFEMLAGRLPFKAPSTAALIHQILAAPVPPFAQVAPDLGVPPRVEQVVRRLLAKDPAERFADAHQAAEAIRDTAERSLASTLPGKRPLPPTRMVPMQAEDGPPVVSEAPLAWAGNAATVSVSSDEVASGSGPAARAAAAVEPWSSGQLVPPTSYPSPAPRRMGPLVGVLLGLGVLVGGITAVGIVLVLDAADERADTRHAGAAGPAAEAEQAGAAVPVPAEADAGAAVARAEPVDAGAPGASRAARAGEAGPPPGLAPIEGAPANERQRRPPRSGTVSRMETAPPERVAPERTEMRAGSGSWTGEVIEEPEF